jgi:methylmalonyl-CoA epimerase
MSYRFLGIDHLGIAVENLEHATQVYRDMLGFTTLGEEILEDRGLKVRFLETGNSRIELLAQTRQGSEIGKFLEKKGPGIHHICIAVDDLDEAVAHIEKTGGQLAGGGIQEGAHATRVAFVHPKTTGGVLMELVEKSSES